MTTKIWVDISSCKGLLPDGTEPGPILTPSVALMRKTVMNIILLCHVIMAVYSVGMVDTSGAENAIFRGNWDKPQLQMTWFLTSPGHPQSWYWPCSINQRVTVFHEGWFQLPVPSPSEEKWWKMQIYFILPSINSSPPSATYMRQWIVSVLVQIMACRM